MFTLIYLNGKFNRPESLLPFLENNIGLYPLLQIDCITPYKGTKEELIRDVCDYLNHIDQQIEITYNISEDIRTTLNEESDEVNYLVIQIHVTQR